MKLMKRGLAVLLAVLLVVPTLPASADEVVPAAEAVQFNTGNHTYSVVMQEAVRETEPEPVSGGDVSGSLGQDSGSDTAPAGDAYFEEDGSYTIHIPEENPFFPYEVQFTCGGEVIRSM